MTAVAYADEEQEPRANHGQEQPGGAPHPGGRRESCALVSGGFFGTRELSERGGNFGMRAVSGGTGGTAAGCAASAAAAESTHSLMLVIRSSSSFAASRAESACARVSTFGAAGAGTSAAVNCAAAPAGAAANDRAALTTTSTEACKLFTTPPSNSRADHPAAGSGMNGAAIGRYPLRYLPDSAVAGSATDAESGRPHAFAIAAPIRAMVICGSLSRIQR